MNWMSVSHLSRLLILSFSVSVHNRFLAFIDQVVLNFSATIRKKTTKSVLVFQFWCCRIIPVVSSCINVMKSATCSMVLGSFFFGHVEYSCIVQKNTSKYFRNL
ncbi:hypothetical protein RF11_10292 [Thelohanellus kitauei]|uniref:Uncharacterized protein n=1 Tax=Thelohanellus kitauei TaxID=669202 RepID=A0A0C2IQA5_THEKT|nr:hypothetical protein RF11_10292 [Thelohanellus kitauei]